MPSKVTTEDFFSPCPRTSATSGWPTSASMIGAGVVDSTRMSRSPMVSRNRRRLPAYSTRPASGSSASRATIRSARGIALAIGTRRSPSVSESRPIAFFRFSAVFSPMPGSSESFPLSMASFRPARSVTPSTSRSSWMPLGPRPGTRISSSCPFG